MSSPFSPETNRGLEETIEAISRSITWLHKVRDDEVDTGEYIENLEERKEELIEEHIRSTIDTEVDNYVYNHEESVETILFGNLDDKTSELKDVEKYISEKFGYVDMPSLSLEELVWLVSTEVQEGHLDRNHGLDYYEKEPFQSADLNSMGEKPDFLD